ncbi:Fumarate hydratase class II [Lysobacter capsici AZ78]|uniref:Fumarate hydratase class II n=1 Tax=Lysobacter capsici AZ78 TaxID=1444315 RepID=A0A125U0H6_9GAMM|nr:class II fumarate hydratase [Lysobacter capsici]KWS02751.1 Fumarate hydratase class II [Lysobacter capsici AZ78]
MATKSRNSAQKSAKNSASVKTRTKPASGRSGKPAQATATPGFRREHDSMGELSVPSDALWGAQTQRAVQNFPISGVPMPREFIRALALVKAAAAQVNGGLGLLDAGVAKAIGAAAAQVADGRFDAHFPIDVYQTGSGTSSNMNANEVIATLASRAGKHAIHPNDHVNLGQSSNDVIPTTIRVSAQLAVVESLLPALAHLRKTIGKRAKELAGTTKTGRTHLMDAMPLTFGQEFDTWAAQLDSAQARIEDSLKRLRRLPIGGTAIGTGINADPRFGKAMAKALSAATGTRFESAANKFEGLAAQDDAVELSGQLSALAVALTKIANDLRWMNSGPLAGLGEIELPALQPGSSIMPGKVNPVIPEAMAMVCAQVIGHHAAITVAGQSGNFQLNVMLPLIAYDLLDSIRLLGNAMRLLADSAIAGLRAREAHVREALDRNPILVTALNPLIGYEKSAAIAKQAYKEGRPVLEVAIEVTGLPEKQLRRLLDPARLTRGGIQAGGGGGGGG